MLANSFPIVFEETIGTQSWLQSIASHHWSDIQSQAWTRTLTGIGTTRTTRTLRYQRNQWKRRSRLLATRWRHSSGTLTEDKSSSINFNFSLILNLFYFLFLILVSVLILTLISLFFSLLIFTLVLFCFVLFYPLLFCVFCYTPLDVSPLSLSLYVLPAREMVSATALTSWAMGANGEEKMTFLNLSPSHPSSFSSLLTCIKLFCVVTYYTALYSIYCILSCPYCHYLYLFLFLKFSLLLS